MEPDELLGELEESGLRGRGGAGFSMGKKASFLPRGEMEKYLCCNADESEPGTFKDRELMFKNPHQLIEGIAIAALAAGAGWTFIFIRGEYAEVGRPPRRAPSRRPTRPATWARRARHRRRVELVVHRGAGAYICGEETALLDSLEGKRGNPRLKPPVPRDPGPLRRPDADQQRRDALERPPHRHTAPTGSRGSAPSSRPGPRWSRSPAACSAPATTRSSSASRPARSSTASPAARPTDAR